MNAAQQKSPPATADEEGAGLLRGVRILVVDDNQDARELIAFVLENFGAVVTEAESVSLALRAVRNEKFSVLISDIGMPDQDGYDLIRCLRQDERNGHDGKASCCLPAVAVTAFTGAEDRDKVLAAGFQAYVAKPFNIHSLVGLVAELVDGARRRH